MTIAHHGWRTIVTDVFVFGVAFGLANVISYLYVVIAGRTLLPAQFGVFNALLGVIAISGFLAASLQLAITQAATLNPSRRALAALMRGTWRIALPGIALLTLASMPFAAAIGASAAEVMLSGVAILVIFLACTPLGFLGGSSRIRAQAGVNLLGTLVRLGVGWPLMSLGVGVAGGVLGYLSSYAAVFGLAYCTSWYLAANHPPEDLRNAPPLRLEASAMATFVLAFAPFSLDQLLVQGFAPSLGGDYAAVATMAKLVFFGAYPVMAVAYPHLLRRSGERSRARLAAVTAVGVICIAAGLAWALAAFPRQLTAMFFADRFQEVVPHVGPLAFGVACFSLSAIGAHALIAWGSRIGFLPSLVALGAGVALFAFRHDSLAAVVANQVWIYGLQLVLMLAALVVTIGRSLNRQHSPATRAATKP